MCPLRELMRCLIVICHSRREQNCILLWTEVAPITKRLSPLGATRRAKWRGTDSKLCLTKTHNWCRRERELWGICHYPYFANNMGNWWKGFESGEKYLQFLLDKSQTDRMLSRKDRSPPWIRAWQSKGGFCHLKIGPFLLMINFTLPGTFWAAGGDAWALCVPTNPLFPLISPASKSQSLSTDALKSLGDTNLGICEPGATDPLPVWAGTWHTNISSDIAISWKWQLERKGYKKGKWALLQLKK